MITAIISFCAMGGLRGLELWAVLWGLCLILYFALFSVFPKNRTKSGRLHLFLNYLVAEIVLDILCGIYFFRYPAMLEYGVGITYGLFMFAIFLAINGSLTTISQYKKSRNNQTQE